MKPLSNVRPEAVALAARLMDQRRTMFAPLRGDVRAGWKMAAWAHGYGADGKWRKWGEPQGGHRPTGIEAQAGWVIWVGEKWGAPFVCSCERCVAWAGRTKAPRKRSHRRKEVRHAA